MKTRTAWVLGLATVMLGGCDKLVGDLLAQFADLNLLGVMPAEGYSDPKSKDHGKVTMAFGGERDDGSFAPPPGDLIEIEPNDGSEVEEGDWEEVPGHTEGSFALLVDGSGSVWETDPENLRVAATKSLAKKLGHCSGDWRMSLMEFGNDYPSGGFTQTDVLADWTVDSADLVSAADALDAYYDTPIWDSTFEVLDALTGDAVDSFARGNSTEVEDLPEQVGVGIVVLSDGADTVSAHTLDDLIAHANQLGVAVHTVGFGPASDTSEDSDYIAVDDLRRLSLETDGYYGFVESLDDLPPLAEAIAGALCGGHTAMGATFKKPGKSGERQRGKVRLKGTDLSVPFHFTSP